MKERLEQSLARIGFFATAAYLLYAANSLWWAQGKVMWHPESLLGSFACYGAALALLGVGIAHSRPQKFQAWLLPAFLLAFAGAWHGKGLAPVAWTDSALFSSYSAHLLLLGENPYEWDLSDAYGAYRTPQVYSTPLLDGGAVSRMSYPALHFLALVPMTALGVEEPRLLYALAFAALAVLVFLRAPPPLRPVALLPVFVNPDLIDFALNRVTDSVWAVLLVLTVQSWRRPTWRAVWYGLACAYKQTPWLLAPFLAIRLLLDEDDPGGRGPLRRTLRFFGIAAVPFLVLNGPFLLLSPGSWLSGVVDPVAAPLVYLGSGLSSLTLTGTLELPKSFYSLTSGAVMVGLAALYALRFRELRDALWLFPPIALWFSYRSLQSYFVYWVPVVLAAALELARAEDRSATTPTALERLGIGLRARSAALLGAAGVAALVVAGALLLQRGENVTAEVADVELVGGSTALTQLEVTVTNHSERAVWPRLAAQNAGWQPYPWRILSGPESLAPGQRGVYRAATDVPHRSLGLTGGGQIVITDRSGDPALRGTARIVPDGSLELSDGVYNSGYRVATSSRGVPWGWALRHEGESAPTLKPTRAGEDLPAVAIGFQPIPGREAWETATLSQPVLFPSGQLSAWVQGVEPALSGGEGGQLQRAKGLQFADGARKLWVLFGPDEGVAGYLGPEHAYLTVAAPAGVWSRAELHLGRIYERLGWPLPPLQRVARGNLDVLGRLVTMSLLVAARGQTDAERVEARFGPVEIETGSQLVPARIRERVHNAREYYTALAERERARGHPERARRHFERALSEPR